MRLQWSLCASVLALVTLSCLPALRTKIAKAGDTDPADQLIEQGNRDLAFQKFEDAVKAFEKANKLRHGECGTCYIGAAVAERNLAEFGDALKNCDRALACATNDADRVACHIAKGETLQQSATDPKRLKSAESEYRTALQLDQKSGLAHFKLGILLLLESEVTEGTQELQTYLVLQPTGTYATYARKVIAQPKHAGQELAPDLTFQTLDRKTISLVQFSGRVVVMDFWATWCTPCVSSVNELKELTKKYPSSQLALISISADQDQTAWRNFIAKKDMDWPQYWDSDGRIRNAFGVRAFPTYIVIDRDGFIDRQIVGLNPMQSVVFRLKDALSTMLSQE